jgi:DNA-binding CsgD family transcriptional regulator
MLQSIAQKRPFRDVLGLALALDVLAWTLAAKGDAAYDEEVRQGAAVPLDDTLRGLLDQDGSRRGSSPTSPAARRTDSVLTRREQEVARLVAEGLTNQEIAERLVISTRTRRGPRRERPPQARLPLAHADRHVVRGSG